MKLYAALFLVLLVALLGRWGYVEYDRYKILQEHPEIALSEQTEELHAEHINGIFKLMDKEKGNKDLNCIGCEFVPFLIFKENGMMITALGGAVEYKIKDSFVIPMPEGSKASYLRFKGRDTIVGLPPASCCQWVRISEEEFQQYKSKSKSKKR